MPHGWKVQLLLADSDFSTPKMMTALVVVSFL
jgi:hypothetical protein